MTANAVNLANQPSAPVRFEGDEGLTEGHAEHESAAARRAQSQVALPDRDPASVDDVLYPVDTSGLGVRPAR